MTNQRSDNDAFDAWEEIGNAILDALDDETVRTGSVLLYADASSSQTFRQAYRDAEDDAFQRACLDKAQRYYRNKDVGCEPEHVQLDLWGDDLAGQEFLKRTLAYLAPGDTIPRHKRHASVGRIHVEGSEAIEDRNTLRVLTKARLKSIHRKRMYAVWDVQPERTEPEVLQILQLCDTGQARTYVQAWEIILQRRERGQKGSDDVQPSA
jgi:hypothetical protein